VGDGAPLAVQDLTLRRFSAWPRTAALSPSARSIRATSMVSSTFFDKGIVPERPKT